MNKLMLNNEWAKMFAGLPDEQAGRLIKAAFACHLGEDVEIDDPILAAVFDMIEEVIAQNRESYEKTCERNAENGRKGGRPKNPEEPTESEKTQSVSEKPSRFLENPEKANRKEEKRIEKNKDNKLSFGEYGNVRMTAKEYEKLSAEFGEAKTDQAVKFLDEYIGDKGYKSKSHYLAIRRWVFDAVDEKKPTARSGAPGRFQNFQNRTDQSHKDMVAKLIAMQTGG